MGAEAARDSARQSEWHSIDITQDSQFPLPAVGGQASVRVNSRHHQAIIEAENPHARIVARAPDGTVEALELKSGRGALFQFHPEDMGTIEARGILQAMVNRARTLGLWAQHDCLRSALSRLSR